jgi:hypothetical protein
MLKHGAATQFKDADAENTELLHSSRTQMLKHGAVTQFRIADAETQRKPPEPTMLKHSHHSQRLTQSERNSRG